MAKHKYGFDEAKIARFHKEGRGLGVGKEYKPWLTIQDVPSLGRSSRLPGATTGRLHHLLSDIESAAFLLFDWEVTVTDIREQFPLDRDETRSIAAEMGVAHPKDPKSRVDIVMTTDLLVDVTRNGGPQSLARAVKPFAELGERRTLEKLEIERRYWRRRGADWRLITEREYLKQRIQNLRWMGEMRSLAHLNAPHASYWEDRCSRVLLVLKASRGQAIDTVFGQLEQVHGFASGEALTALRHLLATKQIHMDMDAEFRVTAPVSVLTVPGVATASRRVA